MLSVPSGRCGPCCSVAAKGNTAIHRAGVAPDSCGQRKVAQSRDESIGVMASIFLSARAQGIVAGIS